MSNLEYLEYSAKEPMALLRKKFNNGEDIYKTAPTTLTAQDASADVMYLKYVFENAYSGFSYVPYKIGKLQIQGFSEPTTPNKIKQSYHITQKAARSRPRAAFLRGKLGRRQDFSKK